MAIEVFTLHPETDGADPVIAEIAIPRNHMPETVSFLHAAGTEESARAAGADREPHAEQLGQKERSEAALRAGILLDAMHDVSQAFRGGESIVRLTFGEPAVRNMIFQGLVRGIELRAQQTADEKGVSRIQHRMMSTADYEREQAGRISSR